MRGFCCSFDGTEPEGVVAVVVGAKYADEGIIRATLSEGLKSGSVHLWCMAQPLRRTAGSTGTNRPDAEAVAREVLEAAGAAVVFNPLNKYWKHARGDDRRLMADLELASYCSRIVVFADDSQRCKQWRERARYNKKIRIVE